MLEGVLVCVECGATAGVDAEGWRMHRADEELDDEEPELVAFCAECAPREFDARLRVAQRGVD